jgi:enoyl-[acyl-carrier protein] reductase I
MTFPRPEWKSNNELPAGKGATAQEFFATVGDYQLEIKVAPWGEGDLKVNGLKIFHVEDAKNRREAFGRLARVAEQYLKEHFASGSKGAT